MAEQTRAIIDEIFRACRTIAVVGISSNPARPSNHVAAYMQAEGYRVVPVNPNETTVLGERAYPSLAAVPFIIDLVNIFRRSDEVLPVVREAVARGAKAIWMQEGVVNEAAAAVAAEAGLALSWIVAGLKNIGSEHLVVEWPGAASNTGFVWCPPSGAR